MRIVAALGGNALLERGEKPDAAIQRRHVRSAAAALAPLTADHELVICHGNGPQVGMLAIESEADPELSEPYPLDALGAQTQGLIGYWLAQELRDAGVARPIIPVVTQTVVASCDPAFHAPTKFIGPVYDHRRARRLAREHSWTVAPDGAHWRRVVPSPEPNRIVELAGIRTLIMGRMVAICAGGGGAPVLENDDGSLVGVEAVVDKDLTAALLARDIGADFLMLLTDVPAVQRDFGTDRAMPIHSAQVAELRTMYFPPGSMGPKIDACCRFVEATGQRAAIGSLADAAAVLAGTAGTAVLPNPLEARPGRVDTTRRVRA